jgi:hypothetical protein
MAYARTETEKTSNLVAYINLCQRISHLKS